MRFRPLLLALALVAPALDASAAPPKKAAPVARGKAHAPKGGSHAEGHEGATKDASPAAEDNPYGAAQPAAAAAPAAEPVPQTASGDAKLDEPPPPRTSGPEGPKPSPLNPEPPESPKNAPGAAPVALDRLIADIATLRARVAALTTSLFSSKLRVYVRTKGDDARVQAFAVTLDDGVVFREGSGLVPGDEKVVYEHAVAPGAHVVGIEIERQDARGPAFRTWQTTRFAIQVPEKKTLEAIVVVTDDSDMADDFPDDQDGKYDLHVRLRAKVAE
jgi:hypothetical protein